VKEFKLMSNLLDIN